MPPDLSSQQQFAQRYTLKNLLGHGGMGEVYVAHDEHLDRDVALKLIHKETSADPEVRQCFNREARAISLMHHPHVVEIYDFGTTPSGQIFLSTELVHGDSLHGLSCVPLPLSVILDLMIQLLDALDHAHARDLIHRDLKAENVLITFQRGRLWTKLADFGLASLPSAVEKSSMLTDETHFGTPGYMAPEQIIPGSGYVGPCTDIYAAGILLYEALSGKLPFDGTSAVETMRAQLNDPVPPIAWRPQLGKLSDPVRNAITEILNCALEKAPWKRFVTAHDFGSALKRIARNIPEQPLPEDGLIEKIRSEADHQPDALSSFILAANDIGAKIRAFEAAEDSERSQPPSHPASSSRGLSSIPPADSHAPGEGFSLNSGIFKLKTLNFKEKITSCAPAIGAEYEFYRDILCRTSVFGPEFNLREVEIFWRLDEDRALADCWREALAAWAANGILEFHQDSSPAGMSGAFSAAASAPGSGTGVTVVFKDPVHAEICQSLLAGRIYRKLKTQAAHALIEAYSKPDAAVLLRTARMWRDAGARESFIKTLHRSAVTAVSTAGCIDTAFALEQYQLLADIYDESMKDRNPAQTQPDIHTLDWPAVLIEAAELCLMLNNQKSFDKFCERLKIWSNAFYKPAFLAHIHRLNALKHLRRENYMRAAELASLSCDSFSICDEEIECARSQLIMADAELKLSNPRHARQILLHAGEVFSRVGLKADIAKIQSRLILLDWFSGDPEQSRVNADSALTAFRKIGAVIEEAKVRFIADVLEYFRSPCPDAVADIRSDVRQIAQIGDSHLLGETRILELIVLALDDRRRELDELESDIRRRCDKNTPAALNGTLACLHAVRRADDSEDDIDAASAEITTAIAYFGPHNRRARAWCHTLLGILAVRSRQIRPGIQAFERARNDFLALNDQFGIASVFAAQSALAMVCEEYEDAYSISLEGLKYAEDRQLAVHAAITSTICIASAIASKHPEKARDGMTGLPTAMVGRFMPVWTSSLEFIFKYFSRIPEYADVDNWIQKKLSWANEQQYQSGTPIDLPLEIDMTPP